MTPLQNLALPGLALACAASLALAVLPRSAEAATVYRCGPAGNVYSDRPCADGRVLRASDERTDAERLDGQRIAALEQRQAAELQRERLRREAVPMPRAIAIGPLASVTPAQAEGRHAQTPRNKRQHHRAAARWPAAGADFWAFVPTRPARR